MAQRMLRQALVQREDELALLEDALLEARRGRGRLIVLAGEAGIGKTRLASELASQARRLGSEVMWGSCSEADLASPYLPFVEAIGNHLAGQDVESVARRLGSAAEELAQLFPQLGERRTLEPSSDPGQAKLRLFEAIVALLEIPARDASLVMVVEDVHWADDSSRELLDHLTRRLTGQGALIVATYRSDELHRRHPLLAGLRAWRRSELAEIIDLTPLSDAGVAEMVAAITGIEAPDPELIGFLRERSDGNPFVLEEIVRDAAGELEPGGGWDPGRLEALAIPDTVRESILQRVGGLEPGQVTALQAAAVLGRTFDYPTLVAVSQLDEDTVQSTLEVAIAQQLAEDDPDRPGRYRFRHALTQEAIYDDIVTPRRQAIHARAADALSGIESTTPVDMARHLFGAGRFAEAVPVCLAGAAQAERAVAFGDAVSLLERALPQITDPVEHAKLLCRIGRDYAFNGEPDAAVRLLGDGIEALERAGEPLEGARYRIVLGRCLWEGAQPGPAREQYERGRDVLAAAGPSAELAMAHVRLAGMYAFELEYGPCRDAAQTAVAIAEAAGADFERLHGLSLVGLGLEASDTERGFEVMDECYREAREKGYWLIARDVSWNSIWTRVHTLRGGLERRLEEFPVVGSWPMGPVYATSARSYVHKALGQLRAALEDIEQAVALTDRVGLRKMAWRSRVHLAEILVELGRLEDARRVLPPPSERTELQDVVYDATAQIRFRLATGDLDGALGLAREILERGSRFGIFHEPLAVAVEAFIAGGHLEAAEAAVDCARAANYESALLDEMQGRVLLARGNPTDAAAFLRGAVEAAERAGYPLVAMRAGVVLGRAEAGAGAGERAAELLRGVAAEADRREARLIAAEAETAARPLGINLPEIASVSVEPRRDRAFVPSGERLVTTLFADVRDYTGLVTAGAPAEVAERMGALYRFATLVVERHGGVIDKFAGDAVMASFNVSGTSLNHAIDALETALSLRDKAALVDLPLGIGVSTGAAILGRGASDQNLTVTGVATNLAARLQVAAGPGEILLSDETIRRVRPWLEERAMPWEREEMTLKGFDEPLAAARLRAPAARAPAAR